MNAVWKYPISLIDYVSVEMPRGAQVLSAQIQRGFLTLWALVDTDARLEVREFRIFGTGEYIDDNLKFIATIQLPETELVFHIFEIERETGLQPA